MAKWNRRSWLSAQYQKARANVESLDHPPWLLYKCIRVKGTSVWIFREGKGNTRPGNGCHIEFYDTLKGPLTGLDWSMHRVNS